MSEFENENEIKSSERRFDKNNNLLNEKKINVEINNLKKKIMSKSLIVLSKQDISNQNKKNTNSSEEKSSFSIPVKINLSYNGIKNIQNNSYLSSSKRISFGSKKSNRIRLPFLNDSYSYNNNFEESEERKEMNKNCLICEEKLTNEELNNNFIECFHIFCDDCYYNYFKEKINNNQIERIKCPQKDCNYILFNNFIERKLINDIPLLEKYSKLKERRQLILNPNVQLCPFPDCESYAEKGNNKYVCCIENRHKFCFNCLKDWHGDKQCNIEVDKSFENWRDSLKVKRCPKCKYFIEKNYGCNHMTCSFCKYQFCWLCLQEYKSGHYDLGGNCFGLQNAKCMCFSNKICFFLYNLLIFILKNIGFAIIIPFYIFAAINLKFIRKYDKYMNNYSEFFSVCSSLLLCISLYGLLIPFSSFISILMFIIWPLHKIIFEFLAH